MDKNTVGTILAFVEKYCTEVEEVEEYLWEILDGNEDTLHEIIEKIKNDPTSNIPWREVRRKVYENLKIENEVLKEKLKKERESRYILGQGL